MAVNFVPLLAPANQMSYDTVQFYNAALAIVAGIGAASLSACCRPCRRRCGRAGSCFDLARSAPPRNRSRPWPPDDWEHRIYGRLSALPNEAEPLQRAQLLAALSIGTEIIQLRDMAARLGLAAELDAALAAFAQGNSAIAIARLHQLDRRLVSRPGTKPAAHLACRRALGSLPSPRCWPNMPPTSTQERPREVHRDRSVRCLRSADLVDDGRGLARHDGSAPGRASASACCATSGIRPCSRSPSTSLFFRPPF